MVRNLRPEGEESGLTGIRKATLADAHYLAPRLRQADRDEIQATVGLPPELALPASHEASETSHAIVIQSVPVAIFGIAPGLGEMDRRIWMVASDRLLEVRVRFLREGRQWVADANRRHPLLWNHADSRNTEHIRWLRWCGFTFFNRVRLTTGGPDFLYFARITP